MTTQLEKARQGIITEEIKRAASREKIEFYETSWTKSKEEYIMNLVANGHSVIPANKVHLKNGLEPIVIGDKWYFHYEGETGRYGDIITKINANIGISEKASNLEEEIKKLEIAIEAGADTIMDLSTAKSELIDKVRKELIARCKVPFGTVPIYQAYIEAQESGEDLSIDHFLKVFEKHAEDGVDFMTVHVGVTKKSLKYLEKRLMKTVSRGGGMIIEYIKKTGKENFLYKHFDKILEIAREYDVTLSLGDALRPGCLVDETDEAQINELKTLGELVGKTRERGVQVIVEGPGHIPLHKIKQNIEMEKVCCKDAPFYVLGPLPIDNAAPYDHIASAIGSALAAFYGADFLCYVTPSEHIGLPTPEEVKQGVIAAKIAARIADYALGNKKVVEENKGMAEARANFNWQRMAELSLFPKDFIERLRQEEKQVGKIVKGPCSMCGSYCPLRVRLK